MSQHLIDIISDLTWTVLLLINKVIFEIPEYTIFSRQFEREVIY